MSDYGNGGHCSDCGGSNGMHFDGCSYDGVGHAGGYFRSDFKEGLRNFSGVMMILLAGFCPPIGVVFFLIFMACR